MNYNKNSSIVLVITLIVATVFLFLSMGKNIYNKEDETMKKILSNNSFLIGIILLVTSLKRANKGLGTKTTELAGSIFVYVLIASFLFYIASSGSFEQLCKSEEENEKAAWFDKEMTQRVASFGFIYILIWKIMKPIFDKSTGALNNAASNATRTKFVAGVYIIGMIQLLFMQFKRPSVFNEDDDQPTAVKIAKNGGLIMSAMMLIFMIIFSLNSKSNTSPNLN